LVPNSEFLQRLAAAPPPKVGRITNIYSLKDNMVVPAQSAHLNWLDNRILDRIGHTGMLYRKSSIEAVAAALGPPDQVSPTDAAQRPAFHENRQ